MKTFILKNWHVLLTVFLAVTALVLSYLLIKTKNHNVKDFTKTDAAIADSVRSLPDSTVWGIIGTDFADEAAKLDSNGQR